MDKQLTVNSLSAFVSRVRIFKMTQEDWRQCRVIKII